MSHFCLLKDPERYRAHDVDLLTDEALRQYWLDLFEKHFDSVLDHASTRYGPSAAKRIEEAKQEFSALIDRLRDDPATLPSGRLDVMELGRARDEVLRKHRLGDPYSLIKQQETNTALEIYPDVVATLHPMPDEEKWLHIIRGVLAGNLFDMGALASMDREQADGDDFMKSVDEVKPRPWLVDDFDAFAADLLTGPPSKWAKAVLFVDNAGSDFILGVMPFVRELALRGTKVVIAANEEPVLNDITVEEVIDVVEALAGLDDELAALIEGEMLEVASTGNALALIDLANVSDELNETAADADMVILEGMGRAVESNFDAEFTVDTLRLALLKDPEVARRIDGEMYDCICRYTPVASETAESDDEQAESEDQPLGQTVFGDTPLGGE